MIEEQIGQIIIVENKFHYKHVVQLKMGDNINQPIETTDPSIDTKHCIIRVQHGKKGDLQYTLRDAPSNTGTFYMNEILRDNDRVRLSGGAIITIGSTTLILRLEPEEDEE